MLKNFEILVVFCFGVFLGHSFSKESACNTGGHGLIPGSRRSPGGGNGYPLQYFCLGNPMNRGTWWAMVYGVQESDRTQWTGLNHHHQIFVNLTKILLFKCVNDIWKNFRFQFYGIWLIYKSVFIVTSEKITDVREKSYKFFLKSM